MQFFYSVVSHLDTGLSNQLLILIIKAVKINRVKNTIVSWSSPVAAEYTENTGNADINKTWRIMYGKGTENISTGSLFYHRKIKVHFAATFLRVLLMAFVGV